MSLVDLIKAEMFRENGAKNKNMFDFNDLDRNDGRFDPKNIVHNQSNEDYDQSVKLSPVMDRQRHVNSKSMHEKKGKNKIRKETGKF